MINKFASYFDKPHSEKSNEVPGQELSEVSSVFQSHLKETDQDKPFHTKGDLDVEEQPSEVSVISAQDNLGQKMLSHLSLVKKALKFF